MCSIAEALEKRGIETGGEMSGKDPSEIAYEIGYREGYEIGYREGLEIGLKALVHSLKELLPDFSSIYNVIIKNDVYRDVTEEQVKKYY